jgi:hypothetical protein
MEVSRHLHALTVLSPGQKPSGTHWIGGWVGPRANLDAVARSKNSITVPVAELNPGRPARSLVTTLTELAPAG